MDLSDSKVIDLFSLLFYVILVIVTYSLTRIGLVVLFLVVLLNMDYHGIDFCLYDNAIRNAAHGSWWHCSLKHSWSYLGTHFSLVCYYRKVRENLLKSKDLKSMGWLPIKMGLYS